MNWLFWLGLYLIIVILMLAFFKGASDYKEDLPNCDDVFDCSECMQCRKEEGA